MGITNKQKQQIMTYLEKTTNLEAQYNNGEITMTEMLIEFEMLRDDDESNKKETTAGEFEFLVEYWQGDNVRRKITKRKAKTVELAVQKVEKTFSNIISIEEV